MEIDAGRIIAGKYELGRLLGRGAMGEVWLATHRSLGGQFAIKLVASTGGEDAETAARRFQREAQIAAKLSRKTRHIVSVSDHGEENGLAYLVMELLEGESLEARLERVGQLELAEVAAIVLQISRALSLAHEEGILHRDLKPANVWLAKDEDGLLLVKLLDFGIARTNEPARTRSPFATGKDMVLGTPSYMSPEQARGLGSLDHRCDLWALAVVAYEALTRNIPFEGETVEDIFLSICTFRAVPARARCPELPPAVEAFFARAFTPKLDERFTSAAELSDAFMTLVGPEELEAALGVPLGPTSGPRLAAARASSPALGRGGAPSDPEAVALGPTYLPRRGVGRIVAVAAAVAILCVGALVVVVTSGSSRRASGAESAPRESASPASIAPSPPASIAPLPPASAAPRTVSAPAPLDEPPPEPASPSKAVDQRGEPVPTSVVGQPAPSPSIARPPPVASPTPTAPVKRAVKPVNKGEIF